MAVLSSVLQVLVIASFIATISSNQSEISQITIIPSESCQIDNINLTSKNKYLTNIEDEEGSGFMSTKNKNKSDLQTEPQAAIITGNSSYECLVHVQVPPGNVILMSILSANFTDMDYIYAATINPSDTRYLTFSNNIQPCDFVFNTDEVTLHIRSDTTTIKVNMLGMASTNSPAPVTATEQIPQCQVTGAYSETFECNTKLTSNFGLVGVEATCQLTCPGQCVCVLYDSEVRYDCQNGNSGGYAIVYPPRKTEHLFEFLDFSGSAVAELNPIAFQKFYFIIIFRFRQGILTVIRNDTFKFMPHLVEIDLSHNAIHTIEPQVFQDLPALQRLILQYNNLQQIHEPTLYGSFSIQGILLRGNKLTTLPQNLFRDQKLLGFLNLSYNKLVYLPPYLFSNMTFLGWLYLNYNSLQELPPDAFQGLYNLREIHLHNNSLNSLESTMFEGLQSLHLLTLDANKLTKVNPNSWSHLPSLQNLNLSHNLLSDLRGHEFGDLTSLNSLDLQYNKLGKLEAKSFKNVENTTNVYVDDISACCYTADATCIPRHSGHPFLTCDRLIPYEVLKFFMWLLGFSALVCNLLVILRQCRQKHKSKIQQVQQWVIMNLAASDFLMGIYMIIITSADVHYSTFFPLHSEKWRGSAACKFASILSIVSSEASIFFVTLISVERALVVLFPFQQYKIGHRSFAFVILTMWTIAIIFGVVPTVISNEKFYEVSQVCIGLPLVRQSTYTQQNITYTTDYSVNRPDKQFQHVHKINTISGSTSWMHFSVAVFLGLNFLCCIIIFTSYFMIFLSVRKTATHVGRFKESHSEEIQMAIRMAVVVLTDFFCWMPIIIMGILVQTDVITLSPTVYAWIVTFVLPINSAVNPFLYTLITATDVYKSDRGTASRLKHARLSESGRDPVTQRELVSMLPLS